jgi:hypothetical protein
MVESLSSILSADFAHLTKRSLAVKNFLPYVFGSIAFLLFAVSPAQAVAPSSGAMPVGTTAALSAAQLGQLRTSHCVGGRKLCVRLTWTNVQMTATVTTNSAGKETSGPGVANVYECTGPTNVCTSASLSTIGHPGSPWHLLPPARGTTCNVRGTACSVAQKSPSGVYEDVSSVAYGQTRNYVVTNTWTGSKGGGPSGFSSITQLVLRAAPATARRGAAGTANK